MHILNFKQVVVDDSLIADAIVNDRHPGFVNDYLVLHYLIRKYKPNTFLEIGTNTGFGTKIISNAMRGEGKIFSLDLPPNKQDLSLQYPGEARVGSECDVPYTQLFGDSLESTSYDGIDTPEGCYIDGEHDFEHPFMETKILVKRFFPLILIYHDSDIPEVQNGIELGFKKTENFCNLMGFTYDVFRVIDTRIAFAVRKDCKTTV